MKISDILIEQGSEGGPQAPIGSNKPTGSTTAPVKRKTPLNPFGANKQLQNVGKQMGKQADAAFQARQEGGKFTPDAKPEEQFQDAMSKTITTGKIDPNLEQSGKEYAKDLQGKLKNAQRPAPKVNQVQNRANK